MNCSSLLTTLLLFFSAYSAICQEYSYTHYDISDGLAGSTVYCITQDKDGFLWMGTETGVSRFDGTHFRNYTSIDGLPDVEILQMFTDSKGRVWMAPFRSGICYYYKGKFHNEQNDSLLRRLVFRNNVSCIAEDGAGNILLGTSTAVFVLGADSSVREFDSIGGKPVRGCAAATAGADGHFRVQVGPMVYRFSGKDFQPYFSIEIEFSIPNFITLSPWMMVWRKDSTTTAIHSFATGRTTYGPFERVGFRHNSFGNTGDSLVYFNEYSGAREYNFHTGKIRQFLPGMQVSRTFRDATGNIWFTTLGQGLFRLNSEEFQTVKLSPPDMGPCSIHAILRINDWLLVGANRNYFFRLKLPDLSPRQAITLTAPSKNTILYFGHSPSGSIYFFGDGGMWATNSAFRKTGFDEMGVKSCFPMSGDKLLVATNWGVGVFNLNTLSVVDTLFRERATTVFYRRDTVLIGTLNGLYSVAPDRSVHYLGENQPFFRKRISAVTESADGTLWVGSYDGGVVGYRDARMIAGFSRHTGLTSDICRTLFVQDDLLWVGTDKGLTRVRLDRPGYPMDRYTSQDGLGSDLINCIYADGSAIYVGTPVGLSFFDEKKVKVSEGCRLYLLSILNSGRERLEDTASLELPFTDKHIRIEYTGISYRSVGDITYRYRLIGLDSTWRTTKETFLEYPVLPSGEYTMQLQAVNKFGISSGILPLTFSVATPWWQSVWFYAFLVLSFFALTWLFVSFRIRQIRNRQEEKEKLSQRIMETEHMALQAQMNPHFIFNCLNSIQQYIFDQDIFAANKYISGFARLIRATLQNSSKPFIALSDEISYLSDYLYLEKLRFKDKMDYRLDVDASLQGERYTIPPMLIQPYVENSMRHGLRHKSDGKGLIQLVFRREGQRLCVTVEDNGIGRRQAAAYKTTEHIEYQSKGMSLTADRIRMMNAKYGDPITVEVVDLQDETGCSTGTRVIMKFPLFHHLISENDNHDQNHFSRRRDR